MEHQTQENGHKGMGTRGVTRPAMGHEHDGHEHHDHHEMTHEQRKGMLSMHHMQTLWVYWMLILLGVWMLFSPFTFSYEKSIVQPGGGRSIWLSDEARILAMKWSDIISGILLILLGFRSLMPNRPVSMWIICFIGVWLSMAPLIFWAPTAAGYVNSTMVGMLVISLSVLIPGMPNMIMYMKMGSEVPPGWSYNPSSWPQRWIMIVAGFLGFIVSRYLAAFQLGYIDTMWDPFFGDNSEQVLNSAMSHSLPISDAGLGTLAYTFEFLMGFMGSPSRWRTMPWMVTLFGILVIPLGLVHIFLVISQPLTVGAWCTFCLLAAGIMLPMIPLEADEVIAMGQHMKQATKKGEKFWSVFWKGGNPIEMNKDERSPEIMELPSKFKSVFSASVWGMSVPWTLGISTLVGIFLMAIPGMYDVPIKSPLADVNHLCGALIVVVSVICMGEVVRAGRYLNILIGLVLIVVPWLVVEGHLDFKAIDVIAGLIVAGLSVPLGVKKEKYGLWDRFVF